MSKFAVDFIIQAFGSIAVALLLGLLLSSCDKEGGESDIELYQHIYQTPGEILVNPPVTS